MVSTLDVARLHNPSVTLHSRGGIFNWPGMGESIFEWETIIVKCKLNLYLILSLLRETRMVAPVQIFKEIGFEVNNIKNFEIIIDIEIIDWYWEDTYCAQMDNLINVYKH